MIRFVDLETGNTFDGAQPYVFWIDGEQSINLTYSKPICFISHDEKVSVSVEENDIFCLVNPSSLINPNLETIYGFEYHKLQDLKTNSLVSVGMSHHNYFIHMIYVLASATQAGEYVVDVMIDGNPYKVGGDFYGENESLYINLANMGIEIPEVIQKAIYEVDIHEEKRNNIVLNRKWKELLSNYWDIVANKGSYKSLYNSLKWFEYGDKLRICEVWKEPKDGRYLEKDIQELLAENFFQSLNGFAKTTYLALYYALEKPQEENGKIVLDHEKNPKLEYVASKWSSRDLALKLCMLGNFYENYFMPIHLDLVRSTIEDVVYTNTFKVIPGTTRGRTDFIYSTEDVLCNVKDGDVYRLNKVECYVGPETLFGLNYDDFLAQGVMIGVQTDHVNKLETDKDWRTFASQMYNDIGAIAEFEIEIPLHSEDKIKRSVLVYKTFQNQEWKYKTVIDHKILDSKFKFNLFCPAEGAYEVRLQFDSMSGKTYTKLVRFNVIDTNTIDMNVYKIYNFQLLTDKSLGDHCQLNDYIFARRRITADNSNPIQYLPAKAYSDEKKMNKWTGICLNHLLIIHGNILSNGLLSEDLIQIFKRYYHVKLRNVVTEEERFTPEEWDENGACIGGSTRVEETVKTYTICVSKNYGFRPENNMSVNNIYKNFLVGNIYREDYIFIPEFHRLVELDNERMGRMENIKYYEITDNDALCVIPNLPYGLTIEEYDWEFINASKPWKDPIKLNYVKEPFITDGENPLEPGYYNIKFNYRLTNENKINSIILDSAFKKV